MDILLYNKDARASFYICVEKHSYHNKLKCCEFEGKQVSKIESTGTILFYML